MKKILIGVGISAVLMFLPVMLIGLLADDDSVMGWCIVDFYVASPLFSVFIGIFSGGQLKRLWFLPIIAAALFWAAAWCFLSAGDFSFIMYALCYAAVGEIAALFTFLVKKSRRTDTDNS